MTTSDHHPAAAVLPDHLVWVVDTSLVAVVVEDHERLLVSPIAEARILVPHAHEHNNIVLLWHVRDQRGVTNANRDEYTSLPL